MRTLLLAMAVGAASLATAAPAQTVQRSQVECISRGIPSAPRAEFRRLYTTDAGRAIEALLNRPEMADVMLGCVEPAFLEGSHETVNRRAYLLGRALGASEMMLAAEAAIAEIDAAYARNLDAAYAGLTAAQRATFVESKDGLSRAARENIVRFASRVSPALDRRALAANPNLHLHLSFYLLARATYERTVTAQ